MVVKAVCVINGDAKGTVFFEQDVSTYLKSTFVLSSLPIWLTHKNKNNNGSSSKGRSAGCPTPAGAPSSICIKLF